MEMYNPAHPGEILKELCFSPAELDRDRSSPYTWRGAKDCFRTCQWQSRSESRNGDSVEQSISNNACFLDEFATAIRPLARATKSRRSSN